LKNLHLNTKIERIKTYFESKDYEKASELLYNIFENTIDTNNQITNNDLFLNSCYFLVLLIKNLNIQDKFKEYLEIIKLYESFDILPEFLIDYKKEIEKEFQKTNKNKSKLEESSEDDIDWNLQLKVEDKKTEDEEELDWGSESNGSNKEKDIKSEKKRDKSPEKVKQPATEEKSSSEDWGMHEEEDKVEVIKPETKENNSSSSEDWGMHEEEIKIEDIKLDIKNDIKEEDDDWILSNNEKEEEEEEDNNDLLKFKNLFSLNNEEEEDLIQKEIFKKEFKFLKKEENKPVTEIEVPKFYSLKIEKSDEIIQKSKNDFVNWITKSLKMNKDQRETEEKIVELIISELEYMDKFSILWAQKYYEICYRLLNINSKKSKLDCIQFLNNFFKQLPNSKVKENMDKEDVKEFVALYNISIELMRIAGLIWRPDDEKDILNFGDFIASLNKFYPKGSDYVQLIEIESICHNITNLAKNDPSSLKKKIVPTLEKIHSKNIKVNNENQTNTPRLYYMPNSLDLSVHSLIILYNFKCNISPITLKSLYTSDDDFLNEKHEFTTSYIIENLIKLYPKLNDFSQLKAFTGLILSQNFRYFQNDKKLSEKVSFESVYIIYKTQSVVHGTIPLFLYESSQVIFKFFAEILFSNEKYEFGASMFQCIIENQIFFQKEYDYKQISELAALSSKNKDFERTVEYTTILLNKAKKDNDLHKVAYLSELLSEKFYERGDFRNAEDYIRSSVEFIQKSNKNKNISTNDYELNLQLKLANFFLSGYFFEKGIDVLSNLYEKNKLKKFQQIIVLKELSKSYLEKGWYLECEIVLDLLSEIIDMNNYKNSDEILISIIYIKSKCNFLQGIKKLIISKIQWLIILD
jgi:hypothetical protein